MSSVSTGDFEQVNIGWEYGNQKRIKDLVRYPEQSVLRK